VKLFPSAGSPCLATRFARKRSRLLASSSGAGYRVLSSEDKSYGGVVWSRHIALLPAGEVESLVRTAAIKPAPVSSLNRLSAYRPLLGIDVHRDEPEPAQIWQGGGPRRCALDGEDAASLSRPMRPQEGTYLAHRQGNPFLGLLPREHAHFGLRRQHRGLHGDGVRMCRDIIR
jgi:hypothetical protein